MTDVGRILDSGSVEFTRKLPGPIERVWQYLTRREYLSTWLADGELGALNSAFELKVEGPNLTHSTGAKIVGKILRCEPPNTLSFTWNHLAPGASIPTIPESVVDVHLRRDGTQVILTLRHSKIERSFTSRLSTGWHVFLDALAARLGGESITPAAQAFPRLLSQYEKLVSTESP
jgi:uncharacterized protein YndB with AHSA1/START domain